MAPGPWTTDALCGGGGRSRKKVTEPGQCPKEELSLRAECLEVTPFKESAEKGSRLSRLGLG